MKRKILVVPAFLIALLATSRCTPAHRQAAAGVVSVVAPLVCTLLPVFAGTQGSFAGTVCEDVAGAIKGVLATLPSRSGATAPCTRLEPLTDSSGRQVGYMCPAYLDIAEGALAKGALAEEDEP